MKIKILNEKAKIPTRSNTTDAGADLYSIEDVVILPKCRAIIKTGIALEIPSGYYGRVAPRSGLAAKFGIDVFAGVVDSSYRGEICAILFNSDQHNPLQVLVGDRIAQIIIEAHHNFDFELVEDLSDTIRGSGGFGSTDLIKYV